MKNIKVFFLSAVLFTALLFDTSEATTRYAGTFEELQTAISNSAASGDVISLTNNIVVTKELVVGLSITINGNGYTLTTPVNGVNDNCVLNILGSNCRIFSFTYGSSVLNNMVIKGGYYSGSGGAIYIYNATLTMNNCIVSNSRSASGGGGICNSYGVLYMNNCFLRRNIANYGGGFLNEGNTGKAYIEKCTFVENRVTTGGVVGGGGAIENRQTAELYMNNSTLSNNQSSAIGGAINNQPGSTVYFINSTATGNVNYGESSLEFGGALGSNGGTYYVVNSLLAYNYRRSAGSQADPTAYVLDDIESYNQSPSTRIYIYNSIFHADLPNDESVIENTNNIQYTGSQDGSDNSVFTGGLTTRIIDDNGVEFGTATVYRPFLYYNQGSVAPVLKAGSFVFSNRGKRTRFASVEPQAPVVAYYNGLSWVDITGTSSEGQEVLFDQLGTSRPDPPSRGALEGYVSTLYTLKVLPSANGSVTGGSIFGDPYTPGTSVTITAISNSGYRFKQWNYVSGGSGSASTNNPYTVTVNSDITLQPEYEQVPAGSYTVAYIGNGNTSGTVPAAVTNTTLTATTISGAGDMIKPGYTFSRWNTAQYGNGGSYFAGGSYTGGSATTLTLYAQWAQNTSFIWTGSTSTDWTTTSNWISNTAPTEGSNVIIQADATYMPVTSGTVTLGTLTLQSGTTLTLGAEMTINSGLILSSGKIYAGAHNLIIGSDATITSDNDKSYVVTDGTGSFKKLSLGNTKVTFPVGTSTSYNPVSITNAGTTQDFSVKVNSSYTSAPPNINLTVPRYWNIVPSSTGSICTIEFRINETDYSNTYFSPLVQSAIGHYTGGKWVMVPASLTGSNPYSITSSVAITSFSEFAVGNGNAFPIFTENFDGTWQDYGGGTKAVPNTTYWESSPVTGKNSWRRNDEGSTAGWITASGTVKSYGSTGYSADFHTYEASLSSLGSLVLKLDLSTYGTGNKMLQFDYTNANGSDVFNVYLSTDGGTSYGSSLGAYTTDPWSPKTINLGAVTSANTRIKFEAQSDYGVTDIGFDNVTIYAGQTYTNDLGVVSVDISTNLTGTVIPRATIKNFGTGSKSLDATFKVNGTATGSSVPTGTLTPGQSTQVVFSSWIPSTTNSYALEISLASDDNLTNNRLTKSVSYTANADSWVEKSGFPKAFLASGSTYKNYLYSTGGFSEANTRGQKTYRIKISDGTWDDDGIAELNGAGASSVNAPRIYLATAAADGYLYAIGGRYGGNELTYLKTVSKILLNTTDGGTWVAAPELPSEVAWGKAVTYNDRYIYLAGGDRNGTTLSTVYMLDIESGTWVTATPLPEARFGGAFTVVGNTLYYVAGAPSNNTLSDKVFKGEINVNTPSTITWSEVTAKYPGDGKPVIIKTTENFSEAGLNNNEKSKVTVSGEAGEAAFPPGAVYGIDAVPWGANQFAITGGTTTSTFLPLDPSPFYFYTVSTDSWTKNTADLNTPVAGNVTGAANTSGSTWVLFSGSGKMLNLQYGEVSQSYTSTLSQNKGINLNLISLSESGTGAVESTNPVEVTVELRNSSAPYSIEAVKTFIQDAQGFGTTEFPNLASDRSYYISVRYANGLETWSAEPVPPIGGILFYDFTTDSAKAFRNNMVKINGKWRIITGDIDQDGIINAADRGILWNDRGTADIISDLNKDGIVNEPDREILLRNKFKKALIPEGAVKSTLILGKKTAVKKAND